MQSIGKIFAFACGVGLTTTAFGQAFTVQQVTQNFDTDPLTWWGQNNRPATSPTEFFQDFGFSNTNNTTTGSGAGEAGGLRVVRFGPPSADAAPYYATDIGEIPLNADTPQLSVSGRFFSQFQLGATQFGYFNQSTPGSGGGAQHYMGFLLDEQEGGPAFDVYAQVYSPSDAGNPLANPLSEGGRTRTFAYDNLPSQGVEYSFNFQYNPEPKTLTLQVNDLPVVTLDVSGNLDDGIVFNRFGFSGIPATQTETSADEIFFDDLMYSSRIAPHAFGDFNNDNAVNGADMDQLTDAVDAAGPVVPFDLNLDGLVDDNDVAYLYKQVSESTLGDTDLDGDVDLNDLGNLATGFNVSGEKRWSRGNFDGDTDVDLNDLGTLASNFDGGSAAAYAQFEALVPEPTSLAMLGLGAAALGARRRRSA